MSPDGYISITGRIKDLIIRGGENIHPLEIENCLLAHPEISEVSIVGVPDERYGEVVAAFVVTIADDALQHGHEPGTTAATQGVTVTSEKVREWVRERLSNHLGMLFCFAFVLFYSCGLIKLTCVVMLC